MRKIIMSLFLTMLLTTSVLAQTINIDGKSIQVDSKNINGITLVPLRVLSETMGADVGYDNGVITIEYDTGFEEVDGNMMNILIRLNLLENEIEYTKYLYKSNQLDGYAPYKFGNNLQQPVVVDGGVSYVPFRLISESLGYNIDYKDEIINLSKMTSGDPLAVYPR